MKVLYVSGKYRDPRGAWYVKKNIQLAENVAMELLQMGYATICPHTNYSYFEGPINDDAILEAEFELLRRCDGIVICPNWRTSVGTQLEYQVAKGIGIPIFYWERAEDNKVLQDWAARKDPHVILHNHEWEDGFLRLLRQEDEEKKRAG